MLYLRRPVIASTTAIPHRLTHPDRLARLPYIVATHHRGALPDRQYRQGHTGIQPFIDRQVQNLTDQRLA